MEDASSSPAVIPRAAPHYVLEPEWPHRAVPVSPRHPRHAAVRNPPSASEAGTAAATTPIGD